MKLSHAILLGEHPGEKDCSKNYKEILRADPVSYG